MLATWNKREIRERKWRNKEPMEEAVLKFLNVSKRYGEQQILSHITAAFPQGGRWCLMGTSGVGKSVFLSLALGLIQPDEGEILGIPKECSAVFQENRLCEGVDAAQNIRLAVGKKISCEEIQNALETVGIHEWRGKPVAAFSGGMKRRVAIVRGVLASGKLLILDEPFTGLDETIRQRVIRFILEHQNGRTLIAATHEEMDAVLLHAKILKLETGGILSEG